MLFAKRRQLALIKTAVAASGSALLISANALASSGSTLAEPVYVRFAQVTDDAYVRSGTYANTNYGDSSILRIKNYHSDFDRHALVRFDSVDLSGSSVIVLRAPYSGASPEENRDTKITQVDPNWNEDTVTYNTMPADLSTISEQSQFASAETLFIQDMSQALQGHSGELAFRFDMIDYVSGDIIEIHSKESGLGAVDLAYSYGDAQYSFDENTTLNFTLSAIDTDGTEISNYAIGNSASHGSVTVDPTTGAVEYVPTTDYVGADTFTVVATGANGVTVSKTVSLTINNINVAPTISGSPETTIAQDSAYRFTPTASDADFDVGDTLTFSVSGNPAWLSIHPTTGELSGTPSNGDVGTSSGIVVSVSDGTATTSLPAFDLTVTNVNDAPSISGTPITSVAEDSVYSFTPTANDIDTGDSISFSVSGNPAWLSIHPTTGELSGTPSNGDVGTSSGIVVSVSDGIATISLPAFDLTVTNVNDAPSISGTPITSVAEDSAYSFTPTADDIDTGDSISFSVSGNPAWLSIDPTTGELSGTPSNGDVGTSSGIVVSVTDGTATTSLPAFDLTVTNVNDAPTIAGTPPPTVPEGSPYSFSPTASDVDTGDALAFSISGHPAWLSIDEANGELSGTPSASDIGVTSGIVVTVTDLTDASASLSPFSIEVTDVNVAPVLRGTLSDESTNEDSQYRREIDVTAVFEDADANDTLTLSLGEASPGWLSFDGNALVGTPTDAEVGEHTVTVVATDGQGASVETDFNLTVVNTDDPATGLPSISGEPVVGQTLVADVSAINDEDGIQSITYRWMRGETLVGSDAQYALGSEDVGAAIALTVIVTDQFGQVMALSSAQLGPVADNNPVLNLISTGLTEAGLASLGILEITGDNLQAYKAFVEAMVPLPTTIQQLQSAIDLVNTAEAVAAEVVDGQSQLAIEANASSLGMNVGNVAAIAAIVDSKLAAGETISTDMLVEASNQVESQLVRLISASVSSASVADAAPLASELENAMGLARVKQGNSMLYAKMLEQNAPTSMADVQSVVDAAALAIESLQQQAHSMERDAATLTAAMAALGLSDIDPTAHSAVMNALLEEGSFESYETLQAKVEAAATKALEHPVLWIDLTQGEEHLVVDSALVGAGLITAHAEIGNPNQNEVRYDWGGSDAQVLAAMVDADDQQQLVIDSDLLAPGQYRLHVKVERNGLLAESVFLLDVDPVGSVASVDRDGDGVLDQYENGLDGADNPLHLNKLQIQRAQGDRFVLQADAGVALKLGQLARAGKQSQAGLESTGIENALIELLTDEQATVETDAIVDWEATGLPAAGGSVRVVMPQRTALGETASYWKHHPATGWVPFVEDPANRLFSAPGDPSAVGVCPAANDPAYRLGLNAGDLCVMLEIQDGGPNDADRLKADGSIAEDRGVNGHVIDPGTVVNEKPFSIPTNAARREHSVEAGLSGGSIGFGSLGVMLAAALFWRRRQHRG